MNETDFNQIIDRKNTSCVKHDALLQFFGSEDLLPMWVADNDYASPQCVINALKERLNHPVLGYHSPSPSYWESVKQWLQKHYQINASEEELHYIPGIVAGIAFALQTFTKEGDKVLVTPPIYPPFLNLPQGSGRELVYCPLETANGRFSINFPLLEQRAQGCKIMLLSNPHNPGGTVWSKDDLKRIASIACQNNMIVISDEIHADLMLNGRTHTSFSTVSEEAKSCSITFMAPSKTFNIAGLGSSVTYVASESLRKAFFHYLNTFEVANGNIFAFVGAEAAYRFGEPWLQQLLIHLQKNVDFLQQYLQKNHPQIKAILPQSSYLAWLDMKAYGMEHNQLKELFLTQGKIAMNDGTAFGGKDYECCFRLNLGCPLPQLEEALRRISSVLSQIS